MISPAQCRAARGLLDWSQQDLAGEAQVGVVTIRQLEAGLIQPRRSTLAVVRQTLEAGVKFIDENGGGSGVRFREGRDERSPRE
jgi:predicted transcriptional regulator